MLKTFKISKIKERKKTFKKYHERYRNTLMYRLLKNSLKIFLIFVQKKKNLQYNCALVKHAFYAKLESQYFKVENHDVNIKIRMTKCIFDFIETSTRISLLS